MNTPLIIFLSIAMCIFVLIIVLVVVRLRTIGRSFVYTVKGKQVVVRLTVRRGAQLYVNGVLEDQLASNASRFTLRAMIEGEELKAHVSIGVSVNVDAYYEDILLTPDSVGK